MAIADAALNPRPVWRSESAYVLAALAGVIGLGNIWRFPYMVGVHGGGSFVLNAASADVDYAYTEAESSKWCRTPSTASVR